ncbi:hypothetical protein [Ralstonia solanacearum]|uniref:hypothetical protein n=1 Tax=Ralstonia solanacearum TaxID=305 RepID=UPI0018D1B14E|nr:hypothetical protein [Ralstonia solanacearum]
MLQPLPYRFSTGFRVSGCRHARRLRLQHMFFSVTFNRVRDCLLHRGDGHERIDVRNPIRIPHSAFRIPHCRFTGINHALSRPAQSPRPHRRSVS